MRDYHDAEWGVPQRDPRMLWEMLMLEGFQAGLAWIIILRKREAFRRAFADFNPVKVAAFDEADMARLMSSPYALKTCRASKTSASHNWRNCFSNSPDDSGLLIR